jgi:hypothetical protein
MVLPGDTVVYKIGMANSPRSTDRMMELLRSWFVKYRFVPYAELRLDKECSDPLALEQHIHKILAKHRFTPYEKVDGRNEMFEGINEDRVLKYLRNFDDRNLARVKELTEEDCKKLGWLLTP